VSWAASSSIKPGDGKYDITLKWTPETDATEGAAPSPDAEPSIFTAIVLVIDHIEMPSEN
jgi:hypothetical protein